VDEVWFQAAVGVQERKPDGVSRFVFLLRNDGMVLAFNSEGGTLLQSSTGWRLRKGELSLSDASLDKQLRLALDVVCVEQKRRDFCWEIGGRPDQLQPFRIELLPCRLLPTSNCVILLATPQPAGIQLPEQVLRQTYGLSMAELRVAMAIGTGKTPAGHAEELGLSLSTVRSQLHSVFRKTGCARQADLVGLIATLTASVSHRLHVEG
jgi:DNA-binding CsgD family transcriptional regulator